MQLYKIKRVLVIVASILVMTVFFQSSFAIDITGRERREKRHKKSPLNEWSFQIAVDEEVGDDDDDDEYGGIRLSMMKYYSKHNAVRFNLGFIDRMHDHSSDLIFNDHGYSISFINGHNFDLSGVNLSVQYMFSPRPRGNMNFFWGIGPRLSIEDVNTDFVLTYYDGFPYSWADDVDIDNNTLIGLGVEASVGMEWFLARNFSLLLEYGFTLQNEWYVLDLDYYDYYGYHHSDFETFDDGLHFDASRIKLGAAFHF